ncbi:MAG: AMP-dependent synthetase/ligase [Myxococcota bacterium]
MAFVDRFLDEMRAHPDRPVVVEMHGDRAVPTAGRAFVELVARARGTLRGQGVAAGDRVVLVAPNSTRWAAADLAVLAEGAIAVPMYARQDRTELAWMIDDCEASLVLVPDADLADQLREAGAKAPVLTFDALFGGDPVDEPPRPRTPDDVVTIIYTSGTSGHPKGVMLTAGNVEHMLPIVRDALGRLMGARQELERVFHYLPFCFAGSRLVLWVCLFRGQPITVSTNLDDLATELGAAEPQYFLNVPALLERIKNGVEQKVREQGGVAQRLYDAGRRAWLRRAAGEGSARDAVVAAVARRVVFDRIRRRVGPRLECLICGSAPLGDDTQRWFEMLGIPVYQVYGLTETTGIVTMDEPGQAAPGRVGHVIEGCEARLGEGDELQVRGPNIFVGYWNRPEDTAASFTGDGWLRTGDQAEVDADGNWRIVGRVKNLLVPTSGHNVAPEPIEQRIVERTPGVAHAVVMGHARPYLTAVVSGDTDRATVQASIDAINAELPHYRRIRAFHLTGEPLTPENGLLTANQKLKRPALEAHFREAVDALYADAAAAGSRSARSQA